MNTNKLFLTTALIFILLVCTNTAFALEMPPNDLSGTPVQVISIDGITARSFIVVDAVTHSVLTSKNPQLAWTPASLTKLITALVFLDTKPKMGKIISMQENDEVGGARIATKPGVKYRLNDLFRASLIASANNATMAVARSTGLPMDQFVARMNQKAKDLGASHTLFVEPTGMDPANMTTAEDYAKITEAAFSTLTIQKIAQLPKYSFSAINNKRYFYNLKNTDKLLGDSNLLVYGGKTGYLEESLRNFTTFFKNPQGKNIVLVLFGSENSTTQFAETKLLAYQTGFNYSLPPIILGTTTVGTLLGQ